MKDSQPALPHVPAPSKYIKESNERFSTRRVADLELS